MLSDLDTVSRIHFGEGYLCTDAHHTSSHVTHNFIVAQGIRIAASQTDSVSPSAQMGQFF